MGHASGEPAECHSLTRLAPLAVAQNFAADKSVYVPPVKTRDRTVPLVNADSNVTELLSSDMLKSPPETPSTLELGVADKAAVVTYDPERGAPAP